MGLSLQVHRRSGGSTCAEAPAVPLAVGSGPLGGRGGPKAPPVPGLTHLPWDPGSSREQLLGSRDGASSQHDVLTGNPHACSGRGVVALSWPCPHVDILARDTCAVSIAGEGVCEQRSLCPAGPSVGPHRGWGTQAGHLLGGPQSPQHPAIPQQVLCVQRTRQVGTECP